MTYFTKLFWMDAIERAIKTVAQSILSLWLLGDVVFNLLIVNWAQTAGVAIGAGVISLLMSIVSAKTGDNNSASLVVATKEAK
jgi:type II secretory pathway component PulF